MKYGLQTLESLCADEGLSKSLRLSLAYIAVCKTKLILLCVCAVFSTCLTGCTLCQNVKRSVLSEPTAYSVTADRWRSIRTYRCWADEAWAAHCGCGDEVQNTDAYSCGFKDGFVDYVYGGGTGQPPPVAPRRFWDVRERNPSGHAAVADWFAGYRLGAQVAKADGYRDRALAPSYAMLFGQCDQCNDTLEPMPSELQFEGNQLQIPNAEPLPLGPAQNSAPSKLIDAPLSDSVTTQPELRLPTESEAKSELPHQESLPKPDVYEVPTTPAPQEPPRIEEPTPDPIPNSPDTSPEVDEVFGPPTDLRSTRKTPLKRSLQSSRNEVSDRDARAAFASALRRNPKAIRQKSNERKSQLHRPGRFDKSAAIGTREREKFAPGTNVALTNAIVTRKPQAISASDDRSEHMFKHLSQ